jgi:uncharacterized RDD family membrane protein YckC
MEAGNMGEPLAGFWLRVAAYIIDAVVLYPATWAMGFCVGFFGTFSISSMAALAGTQVDTAKIKMLVIISAIIAGVLVACVYYTLFESSSIQATPGKVLLGLKVSDTSGRRISIPKAYKRYWGKLLSGLILGIGFMMAGWTLQKQALHDKMAETMVIRAQSVSRGQAFTTAFAGVLLLLLMQYGFSFLGGRSTPSRAHRISGSAAPLES